MIRFFKKVIDSSNTFRSKLINSVDMWYEGKRGFKDMIQDSRCLSWATKWMIVLFTEMRWTEGRADFSEAGNKEFRFHHIKFKDIRVTTLRQLAMQMWNPRRGSGWRCKIGICQPIDDIWKWAWCDYLVCDSQTPWWPPPNFYLQVFTLVVVLSHIVPELACVTSKLWRKWWYVKRPCGLLDFLSWKDRE